MSTITATLVSGQTAVVGIASSREAYEIEVSSGVAGDPGVGIVSANVIGGMLNLTLSNTAVINAGSVMASANTGTITFNGNTIGQLNNNSINVVTNGKEWTFGDDGTFSIAGAIYANGSMGSNGQVLTSTGTSAHWANAVATAPTDPSTITSATNTAVTINIPYVSPSASPAINTISTWTFNPNGSLEFPDNTTQFTAFTGTIDVDTLTSGVNTITLASNGEVLFPGDITQSHQDATQCIAGTDTIVYTSTGQYQHALKLFAMVEGFTDGGGGSWDTQACDIIAVKGYNDNIIHVTTYGVTYTGANAIAIFDGQWNPTLNRIEITCSPVSATNPVVVSVHAIEMTSND